MMVMVAVAVVAAHPPAATIVLVTVYVPTVLVLLVTCPVDALSVNPAGEEVNVPAEPPPLYVGIGLVPPTLQKVPPT